MRLIVVHLALVPYSDGTCNLAHLLTLPPTAEFRIWMGSLASGILTLVGAVTEAIQIDKVIYDGPAELQALFNEGSDLMAILKNINAI